jgi:hypothetical protein
MKSLHPLVLALGLALAVGAAGCSSPCQDLGDRICQCEPEGQVRNNCKTNVKARVRAAAPTSGEASYCSAVLGSCPDPGGDVNMCAYMLNTCAGKVACGLALPLPDGCFTPCQELGERICQCGVPGQSWETCMDDVVLRAQALAPTIAADQTCSAQLLTCPNPWGDAAVCNAMLTTCPGQVACGFATPIPGGGCTPIPLTSPMHAAGAP